MSHTAPGRLLLVTPPLVQPNAPYPATPWLTGILRRRGFDVVQADASLELLLRLLSPAGLDRLRRALLRRPRPTPAGRWLLAHYPSCRALVGPVLRFLQDREPELAAPLASRTLLPEGPRFAVLESLAAAGVAADDPALDRLRRARFLAGLFLDDVCDAVREDVDPRFGFSRYAESLGVHLPRLAPLLRALRHPPTPVDRLLDELVDDLHERCRPTVVGLTVPFPGTLYGALRLARRLKRRDPALRVALGGGFVNTELRALAEPALFDLVDYVCLDDGADPLAAVLEHAAGRRPDDALLRTFVRRAGAVHYVAGPPTTPARHAANGPPLHHGLPLADYFSMTETLNPMHALWSSGRWNKLLLAHGCYWHRCRFCDTTLDYIRRYDPAPAAVLVDWIEAVRAETGRDGFHFVDEALAPGLLRRLADELRRRNVAVSWWGNIRFERGFTPELARKLAASGCIAVSGGLEAAHPRLLRRIHKGVALDEATAAIGALADAGLLVHAYCMYGLPGQTAQETVDALELVRRLFARGRLHSAYWHRFALTVHSEFGRRPEAYDLRLRRTARATFARNELPFDDDAAVDHEALGRGLHRATYNFMHGVGLEEDLRSWFDVPVPRPTLRTGAATPRRAASKPPATRRSARASR
jgi:radical SAM superfamily enzyme YgiQ (UPF0313 family)